MNVIPKTADQASVKFNYKLRGQLTWAQTAERHIGFAIVPQFLGTSSVTSGPFQNSWPASGTNVNFPRSVSTTPGFGTLVSRYTKYFTTTIDITIRVIRQDATDSTSILIGSMPLTESQYLGLLHRNTGAAPTANNSYWLPQTGLTATTAATNTIIDAQIMCIKQQPYVKYATVSMPYNGKMIGSVHQRYSSTKFSPFGHPYGASFSGTLPLGTATGDGTPPTDGFAHYFFMSNVAGGLTAGVENFDVEMDLTVGCVLHDPVFMQNAPTLTDDGKGESKEEKKSEEKEDDDTEDLINPPDFSQLSLTTPKTSSLLYTCLNPKHPPGHVPSSTCV